MRLGTCQGALFLPPQFVKLHSPLSSSFSVACPAYPRPRSGRAFAGENPSFSFPILRPTFFHLFFCLPQISLFCFLFLSLHNMKITGHFPAAVRDTESTILLMWKQLFQSLYPVVFPVKAASTATRQGLDRKTYRICIAIKLFQWCFPSTGTWLPTCPDRCILPTGIFIIHA